MQDAQDGNGACVLAFLRFHDGIEDPVGRPQVATAFWSVVEESAGFPATEDAGFFVDSVGPWAGEVG